VKEARMYMYIMPWVKSLLTATTILSIFSQPIHTMILVLSVNIVKSGIQPLLLLLTEEGNVMMSLLMLLIKTPCSNSKQGVYCELHQEVVIVFHIFIVLF